VAQVDPTRLPRHIAIIMDGNGRWAEKRGLSHEEGHEAGAKSVRAVIEGCREMGIEVLSLYAFSTENWQRSQHEVDALFFLLSKYVRLELDNIHKEDILVTVMGRMEGLLPKTVADLNYCMEKTRNNKSMTVNVAVNYGARAEIADAARAIAGKVLKGELDPAAIDEALFAQHLYVPKLPDIDVLVRTSGELRLSNFMLWQVSYAEIVVLPVLWPDFRKRHLRQAIAQYQMRDRRFGGRPS
jgi:undecaprenyl diphosphate synthase